MNKSESIKNLAQALSLVQSEIQDIPKDKKGHGHKYADLAGVLEVCRPILAKNGLSVSQLCSNEALSPDVVGIETMLMHSSGEYLTGMLYMRVPTGSRNAAQAAGSIITYARRYSLAAVLGVAQVDDDAHLEDSAPKASPPQPHKNSQPTPSVPVQDSPKMLELKKLIHLCGKEDEIPRWIKKAQCGTLENLPERIIDVCIASLTKELLQKDKEQM